MEVIHEYNNCYQLDDIVSNMLHETFLMNPINATTFMANHLLNLNGTSVDEFSQKLGNKLSSQCSIYENLIEDDKKKKLELERSIELLELEVKEAARASKQKKIKSASKEKKVTWVVKDTKGEFAAKDERAAVQESLLAPAKLIINSASIVSPQTSEDTRYFDFVPPDIVRMYKRSNEKSMKVKQEKKDEGFSVIIFSTLSAPSATGLQNGKTIKEENF
jgi:hypothetical protein